jgi:hypothetical protein
MDLPILQRRWKCAVVLVAGFATFAVQATEAPRRTANHYSIRGSLDEVPSSAVAAPSLTMPATGTSVSGGGYTLAAHLVESPLVCEGDEIFANGFD